MTSFEASIARAKQQMCLEAIKSNQYAREFPNLATECAQNAATYAGWLTRNGVQVELTTDGKRVTRVTVDGKALVEVGVLVR